MTTVDLKQEICKMNMEHMRVLKINGISKTLDTYMTEGYMQVKELLTVKPKSMCRQQNESILDYITNLLYKQF